MQSVMRSRKLLLGTRLCTGATLALFLLVGVTAIAQEADPGRPAPPSMAHPLLPSHGSDLLGIIYLAEGNQPHPTAVLLHGYPGFEQNLDLAQALRASGWNVLAYHYRGSWGTPGKFSFLNSAEDADAEVRFVLDPKNAATYHIDTNKVVVIGHSMGGFMAASAIAHNPQVRAAVLLSAWNIGAPQPSESEEAIALARGEFLAPIAGADGVSLAHEEFTHRAQLDMMNLVSAIAPRPVLLVTADDYSDQTAKPLAAALRAKGDSHVSMVHFATDHPYSGKRTDLIGAVLLFLRDI